MKSKILIIGILFSFIQGFGQAKTTDKMAVQMLKNFYTAYITVNSRDWSLQDKNVTLIRRLDSLQTLYCTVSFKKNIDKLFKKEGLDHDLLLNDQPTDVAHLKTLNVRKDPTKADGYLVSYIASIKVLHSNPILKNNVVHVSVIKQNNKYKIANAYGDQID